MKIDGNKKVSFIFKNDDHKICYKNYTLNEIASFITSHTQDIINSTNSEEYMTSAILIKDHILIGPKSDIKLQLEISFLGKKYKTKPIEVEIKNFFNEIVRLVTTYAYELDTEIPNIRPHISNFEVLTIYDSKGEKICPKSLV